MATQSPTIDLGKPLGGGSSGTVHRAELSADWRGWSRGTPLAVKLLHVAPGAPPAGSADDDPASLAAAEWLSSRAARHPALVRVLFAGLTEHGPAVVMQLVDGPALAPDEPLADSAVRAVGARIAAALAALHEAGWSHGDVKPENMRLDSAGQAVLVDLGFASSEAPASAAESERAGTPLYLAPERARGAPPSAAADIFALGVTLYELATGVHPLLGDTTRDGPASDELFAALARVGAAPPSHLSARLSALLDFVVLSMLERRPERRPTAAQVAERLLAGEAGPWWRAVQRAGDVRVLSARSEMPFVGRAAALERLASQFARTLRLRSGRAVLIEGARGSGRTRVVAEFAARARLGDEAPEFLFARCGIDRSAQPAAALAALVDQDLGRIPGRKLRPTERDSLRSILPPHLAETLSAALEVGEQELPSAAATVAALVTWIGTLGRERPCVIFIDDLHRADVSTLEALRRAAPRLREARTLVVLGIQTDPPVPRPELEALIQVLERNEPVERVPILPLSRSEVRELVELTFLPRAPRLRIAEVLWQHSLGAPGLVAEIIRSLVDADQAHSAEGRDARLELSITPEEIPRPHSLGEVIAERYARLPASDRLWLRRLAVVGGRIEPEFLRRAFPPTSREELDQLFARLVGAGWLAPQGHLLRFARPALREAVYRSLPIATRARLHRAAACAYIPELGSELSITEAFQRCFHWRAAQEWTELSKAAEELIERLGTTGHPRRRARLAAWGLEALEQLGSADEPHDFAQRRALLLEAAADAADRLGERVLEEHYLDRLAQLGVDPAADPAQTARIYLLHGRYAVGTGLFGPARAMLKNAVDFADQAPGPDTQLASEARRRLAAVEADIGRLDHARELAQQALALAQHPLQAAVSHVLLGQIALVDDELETALAEVSRALALWRSSSDGTLPGIAAAAYMLRGRTYRVAGRPRRALGSLNHARRLSRSASERRLSVEAEARLGALQFETGQVDEAEARLREARRSAEEIRDRRGAALSSLWLGVLLVSRGELEGKQHLQQAVATSVELGLRRFEALGRAVLARVALDARDISSAEREIERSLELLQTSSLELGDRLVIEATAVRVDREAGAALGNRSRRAAARDRLRATERLLARKVRSTSDRRLRERRAEAGAALLEAALSSAVSPYPADPRPITS